MKTAKKLLALCLIFGLLVVSAAIPAYAEIPTAPAQQCVYNSPLSAGVSLTYSNSSWGEGGGQNLATPVKINTYDYVEYDVYIPGGDYRYAIKFKDANNNVAQFTDNNNRKSVSEYGVWEHVAVPVSNFTASNIVANHVYLGATGNEVHIANLAFTKFLPEVNNVYYRPLSAGATLHFSGSGWVEGGNVNLATPVQINTYDYVEYDVYVTGNDYRYALKFKDAKGNLAYFTDGNNRKSVSEYGKWEHVVVPVSNFTTNNMVATQAFLGVTGNNVYIANLCFTKATEDPCANGHTSQVVPGYAPTCTEPGLSDGEICSVCETVITEQVEIPATGHTPAEAVVENQTAAGYDNVVYCSVCGTEISREHVATDLQIGTQRKGDEARFVIKFSGKAEDIEAYEDITLDYSIDGTKYSVGLDSVYDSFIDENEVVTADDLNCTYVAILEIGDVTGAEEVTATASYTANGETVTGAARVTNAGRIYSDWQ